MAIRVNGVSTFLGAPILLQGTEPAVIFSAERVNTLLDSGPFVARTADDSEIFGFVVAPAKSLF
jgi:hypothetical protein